LRRRGITVLVGTDQVEGGYGTDEGSIWDSDFNDPGARIAEFGRAPLRSQGYPMGNLYLFAARVSAGD
jgi:hypothetical protein